MSEYETNMVELFKQFANRHLELLEGIKGAQLRQNDLIEMLGNSVSEMASKMPVPEED